MLNQRLTVTRTVTKQIVALERQVDDAVTQACELYAAAIAGRRSAHLPLDAGEAGLDHLVEAMAQLTNARRAIHAAHYDFRDLRDTMGIPAVAYGDTGDTPDSVKTFGSAEPQARPLSIVQVA